jgi:MarR family transcriptional regulator for hemolysin
MPTHELSRKFISVIPRTMHTVRREMRDAARAELGMPQFRVMAHLFPGAMTNRELAEAIGVSVPTMSRLVERLVKRGFVRRTQDPHDRRQAALALTPAGRRKYVTFQEAAQERISDHLKALNAGERETLLRGLSVLEGLFEREGKA